MDYIFVFILILLFIILNLDYIDFKINSHLNNNKNFYNYDWFCRNLLGINKICENYDIEMNNIPKIIHHTWKDKNDIPEQWKISYNSWRKFYPEGEFKYMFWTDKDNLKLIKNDFPEYLELYNSYPKNIQRIDMIRYFILYKYGGIYSDMDYEVKKNFYNELVKNKINIIESPYKFNEEAQNSLMASPAKHPTWKKVFKSLLENRKGEDPLNTTGPRMLSKVYLSNKNTINLLDCKKYQRTRWSKKHLNLKKMGKKFKDCGDENNQDNLYGVHHNTSIWNNGKKK